MAAEFFAPPSDATNAEGLRFAMHEVLVLERFAQASKCVKRVAGSLVLHERSAVAAYRPDPDARLGFAEQRPALPYTSLVHLRNLTPLYLNFRRRVRAALSASRACGYTECHPP